MYASRPLAYTVMDIEVVRVKKPQRFDTIIDLMIQKTIKYENKGYYSCECTCFP